MRVQNVQAVKETVSLTIDVPGVVDSLASVVIVTMRGLVMDLSVTGKLKRVKAGYRQMLALWQAGIIITVQAYTPESALNRPGRRLAR